MDLWEIPVFPYLARIHQDYFMPSDSNYLFFLRFLRWICAVLMTKIYVTDESSLKLRQGELHNEQFWYCTCARLK